jgi:hypothetical protein
LNIAEESLPLKKKDMTTIAKLTAAVLLFKGLVNCFSTTDHNTFTALRAEILLEGVTEEEFDGMMNTVFN